MEMEMNEGAGVDDKVKLSKAGSTGREQILWR